MNVLERAFIVHRCMDPFITIQQPSATYPVYVGRDLLDRVGALVKPRGGTFVITSTTLRERFGDRVAASFEPVADVVTIEEGEKEKTLATAETIVSALIERGARRNSLAVIVGGGMIGDTAGFAASIFLRGIDVVQVPTTLLAQVDSSIGGKVAVNHPRGKNLIGSFHPPRAVVADTSVLHSLPPGDLLGGIFEALKSGVVGDPELFEIFERKRSEVLTLQQETIDDVVRRAIRVKANIVSLDERETDLRRFLNYGHTIGHAIEAAMNYEGITHGEAVAWGMIAANAIAERRGFLRHQVHERIDRVVVSYAPRPLPPLDPRAVLSAAEYDKKHTDATRVMVLPREIGKCEVVSVSEDEIGYGIDSILNPEPRNQKPEK